MAGDHSAGDVVKWYTHARRFPSLIGRTSDGTRIPGGPYTPTQLITLAVLAWTASKTTWVWARFSTVGNIIFFVALVGLPVYALGKLPIGFRNPLRILIGALVAASAPAGGRVNGSALRAPRQMRVGGLVAVDPSSAIDRPRPVPAAAAVRSELSGIQRALATSARSRV